MVTPGAKYYVYVDTWAQSVGTFTLTLLLTVRHCWHWTAGPAECWARTPQRVNTAPHDWSVCRVCHRHPRPHLHPCRRQPWLMGRWRRVLLTWALPPLSQSRVPPLASRTTTVLAVAAPAQTWWVAAGLVAALPRLWHCLAAGVRLLSCRTGPELCAARCCTGVRLARAIVWECYLHYVQHRRL